MSIVVVAVLVVLWAWILLPGAVRERRHSPILSVSRFERSMAQLARANTVRYVEDAGSGTLRRIVVEDRGSDLAAARAAARRRQVLTGLTASTTLWLLLAQLVGGITWFLLAASGLLLGTYLGLLTHRWIRVASRAAEPLVRPPAHPGEDGDPGSTSALPSLEPPMFGWAEPALEGDGVRVAEW